MTTADMQLPTVGWLSDLSGSPEVRSRGYGAYEGSRARFDTESARAFMSQYVTLP